MSLWIALWFLVVLKIPVLYLAYVIWWSVKDQPHPGSDPGDGETDGGPGGPRPWRFSRRRPGPHGSPVRRPSRGPLPGERVTRELA